MACALQRAVYCKLITDRGVQRNAIPDIDGQCVARIAGSGRPPPRGRASARTSLARGSRSGCSAAPAARQRSASSGQASRPRPAPAQAPVTSGQRHATLAAPTRSAPTRPPATSRALECRPIHLAHARIIHHQHAAAPTDASCARLLRHRGQIGDRHDTEPAPNASPCATLAARRTPVNPPGPRPNAMASRSLKRDAAFGQHFIDHGQQLLRMTAFEFDIAVDAADHPCPATPNRLRWRYRARESSCDLAVIASCTARA